MKHIFFMKKMMGKSLESGRMHENNTFFVFFIKYIFYVNFLFFIFFIFWWADCPALMGREAHHLGAGLGTYLAWLGLLAHLTVDIQSNPPYSSGRARHKV